MDHELRNTRSRPSVIFQWNARSRHLLSQATNAHFDWSNCEHAGSNVCCLGFVVSSWAVVGSERWKYFFPSEYGGTCSSSDRVEMLLEWNDRKRNLSEYLRLASDGMAMKGKNNRAGAWRGCGKMWKICITEMQHQQKVQRPPHWKCSGCGIFRRFIVYDMWDFCVFLTITKNMNSLGNSGQINLLISDNRSQLEKSLLLGLAFYLMNQNLIPIGWFASHEIHIIA